MGTAMSKGAGRVEDGTVALAEGLIRRATGRSATSLADLQRFETDVIEAFVFGSAFRRWVNPDGGIGGFVREGTYVDRTASVSEKAVVDGGSVGGGGGALQHGGFDRI